MSRRLFRCGFCGHRMRLGTHHCGACYMPSPSYNRPVFLAVVSLGATVALVAGLFLATIAVAHRVNPMANTLSEETVPSIECCSPDAS